MNLHGVISQKTGVYVHSVIKLDKQVRKSNVVSIGVEFFDIASIAPLHRRHGTYGLLPSFT